MNNTMENIIITHPVDSRGKRIDIDYYVLNNEIIATVVKPLMILHYMGHSVKVDNTSKDNIIKILKNKFN